MEALQGASVMDEHRVLMGTVIGKVQSAKSGLNEACSNLLTGFEVSDIEKEKPRVVSSPWDTVRCSTRRTGQRINLLLQETNVICMHKQASLLAATSHSAEVSGLKQRLERTENELGEVTMRLQEKQVE